MRVSQQTDLPALIGGQGWLGQPKIHSPGLHWFPAGCVISEHQKRLARIGLASQKLLRQWAGQCRQPYMSYSGGKDSTVMVHLAQSAGMACDAIYIADAEPGLPEVDSICQWWRDQGQPVRCIYWGSFFEAYRQHGAEPVAIDRLYRRIVTQKTKALGYDGCARGLRAEESAGRRAHALYNGAARRTQQGINVLDPVLAWTADDIWAYIVLHQLPYCQSYDLDDGQPRNRRRIGTLWGTSGMQIGRLVRLKRFYPEHYRAFVKACPEVAKWA